MRRDDDPFRKTKQFAGAGAKIGGGLGAVGGALEAASYLKNVKASALAKVLAALGISAKGGAAGAIGLGSTGGLVGAIGDAVRD